MPRLGLAMAAIACYLNAGPALAQVQRSGNDAARVMQQVQQLTAERNTLQSSNEDLRKQVADLKGQMAQLSKQSSAQQVRLRTKCSAVPAASARDTQAAQESAAALAQTREKLQQLLNRFRDSTATLAGVETERNNLNTELATAKLELGSCSERNVGLYELSQGALDRLERRGFWTRLAEKEPLTRVQRTRLDNLIDDDRQRAMSLRVPLRKPDPAPKP